MWEFSWARRPAHGPLTWRGMFYFEQCTVTVSVLRIRWSEGWRWLRETGPPWGDGWQQQIPSWNRKGVLGIPAVSSVLGGLKFRHRSILYHVVKMVSPSMLANLLVKLGKVLLFTSSAAQGSGGSFKNRTQWERWNVVMHGWQSETLLDRKVVGVVLFEMVAVVTSITTAGCSVV